MKRLIVTPIQPKQQVRCRQRSYPRRLSQRRARSQPASGGMGGLLTRGMKQVKSDGNGNIEREEKSAPKPVPQWRPIPPHVDLLMDQPPVGRAVQAEHVWNPEDRSLNIFVKEDDLFTFHR